MRWSILAVTVPPTLQVQPFHPDDILLPDSNGILRHFYHTHLLLHLDSLPSVPKQGHLGCCGVLCPRRDFLELFIHGAGKSSEPESDNS